MIALNFQIIIKYRMFICRKTFRMRSNKSNPRNSPANKVANSQLEIESANPITHSQSRLKN